MDAELVGPTGLRLEFEPCDRLAAPDASSPDSPQRESRLSVRRNLHPPAAFVVQPTQRQVDRSAVRLGRAGDDRPIGLGDLALLEQEPQFLQRFMMSSQHQAAGGVAIEAMGKRRIARQAETQGVEIVLETFAAL